MDSERAAALEALERFMREGHVQQAVAMLVQLTDTHPDELFYYAHLASLLESLGDTDAAIGQYARLLARQPDMASAHYNLALLHRKAKRYDDAIKAYERAIHLDIDGIEEVYSNLGVLYAEMHQPDEARKHYERALETQPHYVPVLFNLAGLAEERGDREAATKLYEKILEIDPMHWDSLIRLAYMRRIVDAADPLLERLRQGQSYTTDPLANEGLRFAEGKALDDLGRYDEAFAVYQVANELCRHRQPRYDRPAAENARESICRFFDRNRIEALESNSSATPIFICGMFRSGSTLVEQILSAHPDIASGGELDLLPWIISKQLAPYPQRLETAIPADLTAAADEYIRLCGELIPKAKRVTDKRPDNLLHLGLIRALFPKARIVHTRREKRDNCLSVFFQHLGGNLNYANDLADIAHYYEQQSALLNHWSTIMPDNLLTVDYDELVSDPEPIVRRMLDFIGIDWSDQCLSFHSAATPVKTASLWQVREPLHQRSSGRSKNYPDTSISG